MLAGLVELIIFCFGLALFAIIFGIYGDIFNERLISIIYGINTNVLVYFDGVTLILLGLLLIVVVYKFGIRQFIK